MIYCMADLHGHADRFEEMLRLISFSPQDTLYIIGDVIDRGKQGIPLLRRIMDAPNMVLLKGNHEQMCLDTLGPQNRWGSKALWTQNGGSATYRELVYRTPKQEKWAILRFLAHCPHCLDVTVNGRQFHLVHGFPSPDPEQRLWLRPEPDAPPPFPDRTAIVGHTPTCFLTGDFTSPLSVWKGNGVIDIDCGCGSDSPLSRLACLRLDDLQVFYV